jgi:Uma2 family endonuclease
MTATASKIKYKLPPRTAKEVFEMLPEGTLAEVIDNTIYMSPAPETLHQRLSVRLSSLLWLFAEDEKKLGICMEAPTDVYFDENNIVQPDILFITNAKAAIIEKNKVMGAPDLIIEILSLNRKFDLEKKKALYEKFGVKEYFVIDHATKETFTYYHGGQKYIQQQSKPGKIKSKLLKKVFVF